MEGEAPVAVASTVPQPAFLPEPRWGFRTPSPTPRDYIEPITPLHPSQLLDLEDQNEFPKRRKLNSDINDNIPRATLQSVDGLNFYEIPAVIQQTYIPTHRIAPVSALDFLATIALQEASREETGAGRSRSAEENRLSLLTDADNVQYSPLHGIPTREWSHVPYSSVPMTQSFSEQGDRRGFPSTFATLDTSETSFASRLDTSDRPSTSYHSQSAEYPTSFGDFKSISSGPPTTPILPFAGKKKTSRILAPIPATKQDQNPEAALSVIPTTEIQEQPAAEKSKVVEDGKSEPSVEKRDFTPQAPVETPRKEPPRISLPSQSPKALERTVGRDPPQSSSHQNVPETLGGLISPDQQKVLSPFTATIPPTWTIPRVSPVAPVARVSFEDPSRIAPVAPVEMGASSSVKLIRNLSASFMSPLTSPKQDPRVKNGRASTAEAPPTLQLQKDSANSNNNNTNTATERTQQYSPRAVDVTTRTEANSPREEPVDNDTNKGQVKKPSVFTQPNMPNEKRNSSPQALTAQKSDSTQIPNADSTPSASTAVPFLQASFNNGGKETNMPTPPPTAFNPQYHPSRTNTYHPLALPSPSKSPGKSPLVIRPTAPVVPRAGFSPISPPTDTSSPSNLNSQESPKAQNAEIAQSPSKEQSKEQSPVPRAAPDSVPATGSVGGLLELSEVLTVPVETPTPSTQAPTEIPVAVPQDQQPGIPEIAETEVSTEIEEDMDVPMTDAPGMDTASDDTVLLVPPTESFSTQPDSQPSNDSCAICQGRNTPLLEGKALSSSSTTVAATSWIECDGCKVWYHMPCVNITDEEAKDIEKFHCPSCVPTRGPSTYLRKSKRPKPPIDYEALNDGSTVPIKPVDKHHHYVRRILDGTFSFEKEKFTRFDPELVTIDAFASLRGWDEPIIIPGISNPRPALAKEKKELEEQQSMAATDMEMEGTMAAMEENKWYSEPDRLGMRIPHDLTVKDVAEIIGWDHGINVIDVRTQNQEVMKWALGKWAEYYESPVKDSIRNVISLEVSETKLGGLVERPSVVREMDLSDWAWPKSGKEAKSAGVPTSVKLYCLMSVKDSYTDFHVDFGGSSVFYHIVRGKKTFFFIPPTDENLKAYEEWCNHPEQNYEWLAKDRKCYRVELDAGDTMLIPSGWIHAVYTPADSLVIGGNFLTRNHYVMQMKIQELEKQTKVDRKFRYPMFAKIHWYAAMRYMSEDPIPPAEAEALYCGSISEKTFIKPEAGKMNYSKAELEGLPAVVNFLARNALIASGHISEGITQKTKAAVVRSIPKSLMDHGYDFVKDFAIWATWKRACGEAIPVWARPGTPKGLGFPGVSEKNIQPLSAAVDENDLVASDREAYYLRFKEYATRDLQTPPPDAHQTTLTTPKSTKEAKPRNSSSKKRKEASDFDEDVMKEAVSRISGHLALPKLTVLGPMKTACSTCSKKKVRCLHKDEVQKKQKEVQELYNTILAARHSSTTPAYEQPPKKRRSSVSEIERASKKARSVSIPESNAIKPKYSTVPPEEVGQDITLADVEPVAIPIADMKLEAIDELPSVPKPLAAIVPTYVPPAPRNMRTGRTGKLTGIVAKNGRKRACSTCRAVRRKCPHTPDGNGIVDEAELEKIGVNVQPIVRKAKRPVSVEREPPAPILLEPRKPRSATKPENDLKADEGFLPQLNGTEPVKEEEDSDRATSELTEIESDGSTFDGLDQRISRDIPLIRIHKDNSLLLKFRFTKKKNAAIDLMENTTDKQSALIESLSPRQLSRESRRAPRKSSVAATPTIEAPEDPFQPLEHKASSAPSTPQRPMEDSRLLSPKTRQGSTGQKRARASFSGALDEFGSQEIKRPRKERTSSHGASNGVKRDSIGSASVASLHDGDEFFEASKIQEFGLRRRSGGGK